MIPSFKSRSFRELRSYQDQHQHIKSILDRHPFIHCIEVITNKEIPSIPCFSNNYFHVLLNTSSLKDEAVTNDIFSGDTIFVSLSPLDTGNGLFIHKSHITFALNESTYKRFGLQGKKYECVYLIPIIESDRSKLQRIQITESVEGILFTSNISVYEKYIERIESSPPSVEGWKSVPDLVFDVSLFLNPESLDKTQISEYIESVDMCLCNESVSINSNIRKLSICGLINTRDIEEWIFGLGEGSWCILAIWDMNDVPSSFVGNKLTMRGFGGGSDTVFYGDGFPLSVEVKTVEYLNEE